MKLLTLTLSLLITVMSVSAVYSQGGIQNDGTLFITVWKTDNEGISEDNQITIPGVGTDYLIEWEEVGNSANSGSETGTDEHTLTFPVAGTYRIAISGDFTRIHFGRYGLSGGGDEKKILDVEQWGTITWSTMHEAFRRASNLTISASDAPDLSQVTSLGSMFAYASTVNSDLNGWDVSNVISMGSMFQFASNFNGDLGSWDVSNVTFMSSMFQAATSFNSDISGWNVGNVVFMAVMFQGASSFNGDLSNWDVGSVSAIEGIFSNTAIFNSDISGWNVSSVRTMTGMFTNAVSFNGDISGWDVSSVTNMRGMFQGARSFNSDLSKWDVSNVTTMVSMFNNASLFNGDLSTWNVSKVTDMAEMFRFAAAYNGDMSNWDVDGVTTMSNMLRNSGLSTEMYDQTLIGWSSRQLQNGVALGAGGLTYCASEQARQSIIDTFGWTFTGDSLSDDCTTSVRNEEGVPIQLALHQNYPNPFNPATQITYDLADAATVTLDIYTITGVKVMPLISERFQPAGRHSVSVDASALASGVYIYQLRTGSQVLTRKMTLIK